MPSCLEMAWKLKCAPDFNILAKVQANEHLIIWGPMGLSQVAKRRGLAWTAGHGGHDPGR